MRLASAFEHAWPRLRAEAVLLPCHLPVTCPESMGESSMPVLPTFEVPGVACGAKISLPREAHFTA